MVRWPDEPVHLHPFDPFRRGVVPHAHLTLDPARAGFLAFEHELADLAVLAFLRRVAGGGVEVVEAEAAVLGFFGNRIDIGGHALAAPVIGHPFDFLVADERAVDPHDRLGVGLVEHVALAQQLLGALLARIVRLSIRLVTAKLIRVGRLALITPVMTSTEGRWVAMIR